MATNGFFGFVLPWLTACGVGYVLVRWIKGRRSPDE